MLIRLVPEIWANVNLKSGEIRVIRSSSWRKLLLLAVGPESAGEYFVPKNARCSNNMQSGFNHWFVFPLGFCVRKI